MAASSYHVPADAPACPTCGGVVGVPTFATARRAPTSTLRLMMCIHCKVVVDDPKAKQTSLFAETR